MRLLTLFLFLSSTAFGQMAYTDSIERHRDAYRADFLKPGNGPLKNEADVAALRFFAPDSAYRVIATAQRTLNAEPFDMPTYSGKTSPYVSYATLSFTLNGQPCQLTVFRSLRLASNPKYRDYLFLPIKDATSGGETYGGGRYLDLRLGSIREGKLLLDFNKAYNPYCAYSDGYSCPIPPAGNRLTVAINAGEMTYGKEH
ncbi:MAG: DUF1684 domain-containing protein [Spirosoma sp.]|nr:DUF1684 domain-containing protein [Spirosoma sp.]